MARVNIDEFREISKRCVVAFTEEYGNYLRNIEVFQQFDLCTMANRYTIACIGNRNDRRYETRIEISFEMMMERRANVFNLLYEKMNNIAKTYLFDLEMEKKA